MQDILNKTLSFWAKLENFSLNIYRLEKSFK
jgi:hypothetical protein